MRKIVVVLSAILLVLTLALVSQLVSQSFASEANIGFIFQSSVPAVGQNWEWSLNGSQSYSETRTPIVFSLGVSSPYVGLTYRYQSPISFEAAHKISQPIYINETRFGPKDDKQSTASQSDLKLVSLSSKYTVHEFDLSPEGTRFTNAKPYLFIGALVNTISATGEVDSKQVTGSEYQSKFLIGAGLDLRYTVAQNIDAKIRASYAGWSSTGVGTIYVSARGERPLLPIFFEVGYLWQNVRLPLKNGSFIVRMQGPMVQIGASF